MLATAVPSLAGREADRDAARDAAVSRDLRDRVAGKPQNCIRPGRDMHARIVGNAIVYEDGARWYVTRPNDGRCNALRPDRIIVTRSFGGELCRGEIFQLADTTGPGFGTCAMGDFTPYTRPKR
jgi:hypothetical protein